MLKYSLMVAMGLVSIVVGLIIFFVLAAATRKAILDEIVIDSKAHKNYDSWVNNYEADDNAIYYEYYLFNLTNPNEFAAGTAKPNFAEVGPFTYRSYVNKTNVTFPEASNGDKVHYYEQPQYVYDATNSNPTYTRATLITNINPYYTTVRNNIGMGDYGVQLLIGVGAFAGMTAAGTFVPTYNAYAAAAGLTSTFSTVEMTAIQAIFGSAALLRVGGAGLQAGALGVQAVLAQASLVVTTQEATDLLAFLNYVLGQPSVAAAMKGFLFRTLPAETHLFGGDPMLNAALGTTGLGGYVTNYTGTNYDGPFECYTGKSSASLSGMNHFTEYKGVTKIDTYKKKLVVDGRTKTMEPFQGATPDTISLYYSTLRHYIEASFHGVEEVEGIETARYIVGRSQFDSTNDDLNRTIAGFSNITVFSAGTSFFMSLPYFGEIGENKWRDAITTGDNRYDDHKHRTYLDLEPITGFALQAAERTQLNLFVNFTNATQSVPAYAAAPNAYNGTGEVMAPLFWAARRGIISADNAKDLRKAVVTAVVARRAILGSLVGFGVVCVLIGAALMVQKGGNESSSSAENADAAQQAKTESIQETEVPNQEDNDLQPFVPPPPVPEDQEMDNVGPAATS